jgi:hypothetical protein
VLRQGGGEQGGRQGHAAASQAAAQQFPAARQPVFQRPQRTVQLLGRFVARLPLQVTEQQGSPVALRQPPQFLIENLTQLPFARLRPGLRYWHFHDLPFLPASARAGAPEVRGHPGSDLVEPVDDRRLPADRARLPGQHQEGGLEGVFRILRLPQATPTDAQHQRPMAPHQGRKGGLVALAGKALEELPVTQLAGTRHRGDPAQLAQYGVQGSVSHGPGSPGGGVPTLNDGGNRSERPTFFHCRCISNHFRT